VLLILLAVVAVSAGVRLLLLRSSSFKDSCPATGGGALLDVSGDVTMHDAVFVIEDDNCLWDSLPGMDVEFDSGEPAALAVGGPTRLGSSRNVSFDLSAGAPIVEYSTDLAANRHACTIDVEDSTTGPHRRFDHVHASRRRALFKALGSSASPWGERSRDQRRWHVRVHQVVGSNAPS
jgi:hypothetical protein